MKKCLIITLVFFLVLSSFAQSSLKLWYNQPAKDCNEALPIGNGRLGAMVFGRPGNELLQLNEQFLLTQPAFHSEQAVRFRKNMRPHFIQCNFRKKL
jgi:hypothetical protein